MRYSTLISLRWIIIYSQKYINFFFNIKIMLILYKLKEVFIDLLMM